MSRKISLVLVLLCAGLVGCGGGGGGDTSSASNTTAEPADAAFVQQADQICSDYLRDYAKAAGTPKGLKELSVASRKGRRVLTSSLKKLDQLEVPESAKTDYDKYTKSFGTSGDLLEKLATAAGGKKSKRVTAILQQLSAAAVKQGTYAKAAGLKVCGKAQA